MSEQSLVEHKKLLSAFEETISFYLYETIYCLIRNSSFMNNFLFHDHNWPVEATNVRKYFIE